MKYHTILSGVSANIATTLIDRVFTLPSGGVFCVPGIEA